MAVRSTLSESSSQSHALLKASKPVLQQRSLQLGRGSLLNTKTRQQFLIPMAAYVCVFLFFLQLLTESATAAPVLASSLGFCKDVPVLKGAPLHCCLPQPTRAPIRFTFPRVLADRHGKPILRERKPAHIAQKDPEYVKKYNLAYARMKALPDSDPRSFLNQWRVHCSFCNEAFKQRNLRGKDTGVLLQVHFSWSFLPWHRMYLYFHERILASLINDPTFALPFWNWDNAIDFDAGMIPAMYLPKFPVPNSALHDKFRNPNHLPPKILNLGYSAKLEAEGQNLTDQQIRYQNLCVMYNQVTTKVSARDFLGGPYVVGTDNTAASANQPANGTVGESGGLENAHNIAHEWTGLINDPDHPDNEDMGNFIFAARDPIFYAHHSNVDRLWDVWKTLPDRITRSGDRKRTEFKNRDFLDFEFTFYDENGDLVISKISDSLDSAKLGYKFTNVSEADDLWINYEPLPPHNSPTPRHPKDYPAVVPNGVNHITLDPISYKLGRRAPTIKDLQGKELKSIFQLQENVLFERVKIPQGAYARFDVFINYPAATRKTHLYMSEYVGTFTHLPSGIIDTSKSVSESSSEKGEFLIVNIRFSINAALQRLGVTDCHQDIIVTIVSKGARDSTPKTGFTFANLKQDFQ